MSLWDRLFNKSERKVHVDVLDAYFEAADACLSLISSRQIDGAVAAFDRLYSEYGGKQTWLNYAYLEIPKLCEAYGQLGAWRESGDSLEHALLSARETGEKPPAGTANMLLKLGSIKRFLLRNEDAVELLIEGVRLESHWPELDYSMEHFEGLAREAENDATKDVAGMSCWNVRSDGSLFKDSQNVIQ